MADNIFPAVWQVFDANGDPAAGAKAYFYDTGTTNARTVYSDVGGVTPHASPLVADGNGVMPEVFVTGGTAVKVVVTESDGTALYTQDPVTRTAVSSAANGISFTPTAEIAQTNVQDAIEQVQANYTADLAAEVSTLDAAKQDVDADLTAIAGLTRTRGDLITGGASAWQRLAVGTSGQVLTSDGTDVVWSGGEGTISTSGTLTFPVGSQATWNHGLGATPDPDKCGFYLVWKGGATGGFVNGDIIHIAGTADDDSSGAVFIRTSTQLKFAQSGALNAMTNASGTGNVTLSSTNVDLVMWVRA